MHLPSSPIYLKTLVAIAGLLITLGTEAAIKDYPFRVDNVQSGRGHLLIARNDGQAPITVRIFISGENIASDRGFPATVVVPPRAHIQIANIFGANPQAGYLFRTNYTHSFGDLSANPLPDVEYRLPFKDGLSFPISQAYGGVITTHDSPDSAYAVDFPMPEMTSIVAARAGTVIDITNWNQYGAKDPIYLDKANSITILHDDGTMAQYVHLAPAQSPVYVGKRVNAGDHIGFSGNTGYSSGPHLHFVVSKAAVQADGRVGSISIPVTFYTLYPSARFRPLQGAMVAANYSLQPANQAVRQVAEQAVRIASAPPVLAQPAKGEPPNRSLELVISLDRGWLMAASAVAAIAFVLLLWWRLSTRQPKYTYRLEPSLKRDPLDD